MEKFNIWNETCAIRFNTVDRCGRMMLDAALNFFQEAAISHAENLGVGREALARCGQGWILSRMSVQISRRPAYRETVTVRSWPRGGEKLFALRDYDIRDADNIPIVRARSGWLIIDIEKRRPLRPQAVMDALPQNEGENALLTGPVSLAVQDNLQKAAERRALYTDVDYNGHVNNVRYVQWIQDILDLEPLEKAGQMRLDINYLNEILPGELTGIWFAPLENASPLPDNAPQKETAPDAGQTAARQPDRAFAFEGRKTNGGQAAFRAELRLWE
jgi:acyl-ACP thioesterase